MTSLNPTRLGRARTERHPPELWRVPVLRTERVTPRLARLTVGGPELATFPGGGGDQHVVLYFYDPATPPPEPLTLATARTMFGQVRPAMRSYTVRRYDPDRHEIDLDFVLHGEDGPGAAFARAARPGDPVILVGPSPAYRPDPGITDHLLVGDETALPAIAAMIAALPAGVRVRAVIEVADAAEEQPLTGPAEATVRWLHRDGRPPGTPDALVAALDAVPADGAVWAAGERAVMRTVRAWLLDHGMDRARVRTATYWRHGQAGPGG